MQHLSITHGVVARQMVAHLPWPYEVDPVDQLRADCAAPPAEQGHVCGAALEGGAHVLDGEGAHAEDHLLGKRSKY